MARRKRLSPAAALGNTGSPLSDGKPNPPPIASVVADAAGQAALGEMATEYAAARTEGRLVLSLSLDAIEDDHLVRDRLAVEATEMDALKASIAHRGQQTPIEVEDLGQGRYGLISGWRRLEALRALHRETKSEGFALVRALIRNLETVSDAYIAMVEENEIRANLSFYERARIAARASERGVYPTAEAAVRDLFRHASRAKRSKIQSFLRLYQALDGVLRFPTALSERQGLALIKLIEQDGAAAKRLTEALQAAAPATQAAEQAVLVSAMSSGARSKPKAGTLSEVAAPTGVRLRVGPRRIELTGAAITDDLVADMQAWLAERFQS